MKEKKWLKFVIIGVFLLILLLIVFFVVGVSDKVDVKYDDRGKVYGVWKIKKYNVYENGKLKESVLDYNQVSINFSKENIEFCYSIDQKWDCFSHNYWMKNGILTVYMFESDKTETNFNYTIRENTFELKHGDDKNYTLSIFDRMS